MRRIYSGEEAWHGTLNGYGYHGCRCAACTRAWSDEKRAVRYRRGIPATFRSNAELDALLAHDHLGDERLSEVRYD